MLRITVHYEEPLVVELQLPGWFLDKMLQYFHIKFFPHFVMYFLKCTSFSCSLLTPQHDPTTSILGSRTVCPGLWGRLPNVALLIMVKQFRLSSSVSPDYRTTVSRKEGLCPCVHSQSAIWVFYDVFIVMVSCTDGGPKGLLSSSQSGL